MDVEQAARVATATIETNSDDIEKSVFSFLLGTDFGGVSADELIARLLRLKADTQRELIVDSVMTKVDGVINAIRG